MPRKPRAATAKPALTTAQALGSLLKSARDIMRKDKGLTGCGKTKRFQWIVPDSRR
jgi:hypothetical protein